MYILQGVQENCDLFFYQIQLQEIFKVLITMWSLECTVTLIGWPFSERSKEAWCWRWRGGKILNILRKKKHFFSWGPYPVLQLSSNNDRIFKRQQQWTPMKMWYYTINVVLCCWIDNGNINAMISCHELINDDLKNFVNQINYDKRVP